MIDGLKYKVNNAAWELSISETALKVFRSRIQKGCTSTETVGQLYSMDLTGPIINIDLATCLKPKKTFWNRVNFDTTASQNERNELFNKGYHCIGLWHTHPELSPTLSVIDLKTAQDHAFAAKPILLGVVFAIVGNDVFPKSLKFWIHDGNNAIPLVISQ